MKTFSATRFWLISNARGGGRTGAWAMSVAAAGAGTFSNSKVTTSTPAAKRASASVSS